MTQEHPITPPPDLVQQLRHSLGTWLDQITIAYAAGADQELEACCEWLDDTDCEDPQEVSLRLRWHRRPKPPSLKEQALNVIKRKRPNQVFSGEEQDIIQRALEQL